MKKQDIITCFDSIVSNQNQKENMLNSILNDKINHANNSPRKRLFLPLTAKVLGPIAAAFILFMVAVNISPTLAQAIENIPGLNRLSLALSNSPSLHTAIAHGHVQYVGLEQSMDDITLRIEHIIADQQHLHIFYTLEYSRRRPSLTVLTTQSYVGVPRVPRYVQSEALHTITTNREAWFNLENGLQQLSLSFFSQTPDTLDVTFYVIEAAALTNLFRAAPYGTTHMSYFREEHSIARFVFTLDIDPIFMEPGEIVTLDYDFALEGQQFTITTVEIFPTQMHVNVTASPYNTALLQRLRFHFENEMGQRFESIADGISMSGMYDAETMRQLTASFRLESAFFANSESLSMHIEEAAWLDNDRDRIRVDLINGTTDWLPDSVSNFRAAQVTDNNWCLEFSFEGLYRGRYQRMISSRAFDEDGNQVFGSTVRGGELETFEISNYQYNVIYIMLEYTRVIALDIPVEIRVK